jgi:acyl-CoA synthetase (AMP-forming)/AMP-acid ligase II
LFFRDNVEAFVQMMSVWMLGATAAPIDFRAKLEKLAELSSDFNLALIIADRELGEDLPFQTIVVGDGWHEPPISDSIGAALFAKEAPALLIFTSGTTGKPVGIVLDHDRLLLRVLHPLPVGERDAGGRMLNPIPLSFAMSIHNTLAHMVRGGSVEYLPAIFGVSELNAAVSDPSITSLCLVPTLLRGLLDLHSSRETPAYPNLKLIYCGGAPLQATEKVKASTVLSNSFVELYANSLSGRLTFSSAEDIKASPHSVGRILPQVLLQIVDDVGNELLNAQTGSIRVRSPGMARCLVGGATAKTTGDRIADGWVYTGDTGYISADGFLYLAGRDSDVIIRGGVNVYPAEVELAFADYPGIHDVAVVGYASEREGEEIAVFIVADSTVTEATLLGLARARLSSDKVPRRFEFLTALPRNPNGKVMRETLRKLLDDR